MRTFGQFKQRVGVQRDLDLSSAEKAILKAFCKGEQVGRSDAPRCSPYMPGTEEEKHVAWLLGYDEQAERYVISRAEAA